MENSRTGYLSDISNREWEIARQYLPQKGKLGRPQRYHRRAVMNAIMYVTKTGCSWRDIPNDLPPWRLVYHYFASWQKVGLWQRLHDALREKVRLKSGKKKPRRQPYLILKRLKLLISPDYAAMMLERRWSGASDTFWWTLWA